MKKGLNKILNGKNSLTNGFIALVIVGLIALGCTCNEKDGFKVGKDDSNSATPKKDTKEEGNPFETPSSSPEEKADASKKEIPTDAELQEIVKETMMNFNDAIQQGDFSDFHKTISKEWQKQTKPKTFEDGFRTFIERNVDLSQIRSQKADFTSTGIDNSKSIPIFKVDGTYPTSPEPTTFKLQYVPNGKDWKLFAIDVRTKSFRK